MNRDATETCPQNNMATATADPNVWAASLDAMAHDVELAGNSYDRFQNACGRTGFHTISIAREGIKGLV